MKLSFLKYYISKITQSKLFWLLLISFTIRNLFHLSLGTPAYNADTASYCYAAENILKGLIDEFRPPVYPLIMSLINKVNPDQYFENLVLLQRITSFMSIIPFYLTCKQHIKNKAIVFAVSLLYAIFPAFIVFNHSIYPESFLISFIAFFIYLFSLVLEKPTTGRTSILCSFILILTLLKPVSIILFPTVAFVLLAKYFIERDFNLRPFVVSFTANVILLLMYCQINYIQNDFRGISTVTHDNNFLNVIVSGTYKNIPDEAFVNTIDSTLKYGIYYSVYYLNNDHEINQLRFNAFPNNYLFTKHLESIQSIPPNSLGYNRQVAGKYLAKIMRTKEYVLYMFNKCVFFAGRKFYFTKGYFLYLLLILEITICAIGIFTIRKLNWFRLFVLISSIGIIATTIIGGVDDGTWGRVLLPVYPFIIILTGVISDSLFNTANNLLNKRSISIQRNGMQ